MKWHCKVFRQSPCAAVLAFAALAVSFTSAVRAQQPGAQTPAAQAPAAQTPPAPGRGGRGAAPVDPRVQIRTYHFPDTNEDIPYALFVSSKVSPNKKNPLIVTLHGLGGTHTTMMRANAIDLAEAGGYILLAPMGYNPRGWYGIPAGPPRAGGAGRGANANDPPNLRELSEKDTMNVLALIRKEFNVDDQRIYLMGHSMGGAGTYYLAVKYPDIWAAIGVLAPAAFGLQPSSLSAVPKLPVIVIHGDMDEAVPVSLSRTWVEEMKARKMTYQYIEVPGGTHGSVITSGQPDIFAFFAKYTKGR
jgi:predicted peptidase